MELLVSSETSALKAQTPGDYPKDTIGQYTNLFLAKRETFSDHAEVQRESLAALDSISDEDFR